MEKVIKRYIFGIIVISGLWSISCLYAMEELIENIHADLGLDEQLSSNENMYLYNYKGGGMTRLHAATDYGVTIEVVKELIARGEDVNAKTDKGRTALHYASHRNDNDTQGIITLLVKAGAQLDAQDNGGDIPLFFPATEGRSNNCKIMLCQPPVTMTSEICSKLLAFLCAHKFSTKKYIKKLPKDVIFHNIFPYICPWFPFTDQLVGEYINLQLKRIKRVLLIKNNKGETVFQNGTSEVTRPEWNTAPLLDPDNVEQHRWLIEKNIRALNPCLRQIEETESPEDKRLRIAQKEKRDKEWVMEY